LFFVVVFGTETSEVRIHVQTSTIYNMMVIPTRSYFDS
jgi:hypothetical protein